MTILRCNLLYSQLTVQSYRSFGHPLPLSIPVTAMGMVNCKNKIMMKQEGMGCELVTYYVRSDSEYEDWQECLQIKFPNCIQKRFKSKKVLPKDRWLVLQWDRGPWQRHRGHLTTEHGDGEGLSTWTIISKSIFYVRLERGLTGSHRPWGSTQDHWLKTLSAWT